MLRLEFAQQARDRQDRRRERSTWRRPSALLTQMGVPKPTPRRSRTDARDGCRRPRWTARCRPCGAQQNQMMMGAAPARRPRRPRQRSIRPRLSWPRCSAHHNSRSDRRSDDSPASVSQGWRPGRRRLVDGPGLSRPDAGAGRPTNRRKTLVVIFQRGGADGLNIVVPFGDAAYYDYRPNIAIAGAGQGEAPRSISTGTSGCTLRSARSCRCTSRDSSASSTRSASPDTGNRSHFQAQDFMESAAPGNRTVSTGWLNRYLQAAPDPDRKPASRDGHRRDACPRRCAGPASAMTLGSLGQFGLQGGDMYESMYSRDSQRADNGHGPRDVRGRAAVRSPRKLDSTARLRASTTPASTRRRLLATR